MTFLKVYSVSCNVICVKALRNSGLELFSSLLNRIYTRLIRILNWKWFITKEQRNRTTSWEYQTWRQKDMKQLNKDDNDDCREHSIKENISCSKYSQVFGCDHWSRSRGTLGSNWTANICIAGLCDRRLWKTECVTWTASITNVHLSICVGFLVFASFKWPPFP